MNNCKLILHHINNSYLARKTGAMILENINNGNKPHKNAKQTNNKIQSTTQISNNDK